MRAVLYLCQEPLRAIHLWYATQVYAQSLEQELAPCLVAAFPTDHVLIDAGATLFSFVAALVFFLLELVVYQTVSWQRALQPLIIAGQSCCLVDGHALRVHLNFMTQQHMPEHES
jgi:hypothetical protein